MQAGQSRSLTERLRGAALLVRPVYRDVAGNGRSNWEAAAVVLVAALGFGVATLLAGTDRESPLMGFLAGIILEPLVTLAAWLGASAAAWGIGGETGTYGRQEHRVLAGGAGVGVCPDAEPGRRAGGPSAALHERGLAAGEAVAAGGKLDRHPRVAGTERRAVASCTPGEHGGICGAAGGNLLGAREPRRRQGCKRSRHRRPLVQCPGSGRVPARHGLGALGQSRNDNRGRITPWLATCSAPCASTRRCTAKSLHPIAAPGERQR